MAEAIALIDYGAGNLQSVHNALKAAGAERVAVTNDPRLVRGAKRIVLPGVGSFKACMEGLSAIPGMIEALERLPDEVHLVVVGGTPDMVEAAGRDVAARRLTTRVHLVGRAADPRPFFHAGDVFVLPSAYESYGLVVLEALAGGLPVVATPVGVVPAVVRDGETGYAVPARPDEVARAVTALRALPKDRLAKAARAVAEEHSWSAVAGRYLDLFDELRSERGAAR